MSAFNCLHSARGSASLATEAGRIMLRRALELVQRAARLEAPAHELSAALAVTQATSCMLAPWFV
jgi:hypothetical protein